MIQPFTEAPALETRRTLMRPHRREDFEPFAAMSANPVVTRFTGHARTREESWLRFLRHRGLWSMLGFGYWAIESKETGAFIGEAGFHDMRRDMDPSIEGLPEAGWSLTAAMHGQGLGTEIVNAIHAWSDAELHVEKTVCIIDPDHVVSISLARRSGYGPPADAYYREKPILLFERRRGP